MITIPILRDMKDTIDRQSKNKNNLFQDSNNSERSMQKKIHIKINIRQEEEEEKITIKSYLNLNLIISIQIKVKFTIDKHLQKTHL